MATKKNLAAQAEALRSHLHHHSYRYFILNRAGCLPRGKGCYYKKKCNLLGRGLVRFCHDCRDFPCQHLKTLDKRYRTFYHMSMIENLEYIKKHGMERFLEQQTAKWRCPECGEVICCHNGLCYRCQLDKLRQKKHKYRWEE